jgi:Outer membrane protein beta-barrel domain
MKLSTRLTVFALLASAFFLLPASTFGQGLELAGGYAHATGDLGLDGFNAGAAWWVTPRVSLAGEIDGLWDTSRVGVFELTSAGNVSVKSNLQNYLVGPRVSFPGAMKGRDKLIPFAELQMGLTHLQTRIQEVNLPDRTSADTAFSWMLGGGADYLVNPHWTARINLDLLRTHLADAGQSRLRLVLGMTYTFGERTP